MIVDKAIVVTCPFCGAEKELLSLRSGNTFRATVWSDAKQLTPMLPTVSCVQKCLNCGKYFLWYKVKRKRGLCESFETGNLSYHEWKRAYLQFKKDSSLAIEDKRLVYMGLIQAFNDQYYRGPSPLYYMEETIPEPEGCKFFVDVVKELINFNTWSSPREVLLKAELYREACLFDECEKTLASIDIFGSLGKLDRVFFNNIESRAKMKISKVFQFEQ